MTASPSRLASRLALESAVIIASILAAFALDAWWDERKERREEREALTAMEIEFSRARESILFYRDLQARILVSVTSVKDSVAAAHARGATQVVVPDTAVAWAYIPPTTSLTLSTLEGLVASGRLGIIQGQGLRSALGSWGSELAELQEEEEASRNLAHGDMDRTFRARMDTNGLWATAARLFGGELEPSAFPRTRTLPVDTEMLGVYHLRESILVHALEEFDPLLDQVDQILALLRASLEG